MCGGGPGNCVCGGGRCVVGTLWGWGTTVCVWERQTSVGTTVPGDQHCKFNQHQRCGGQVK